MTNSPLKPLSLARVQELFESQDWEYTVIDEQRFQTGFRGVAMLFGETEFGITIGSQAETGLKGPEGYARILDWTMERDTRAIFPTTHVVMEDEGDEVLMRASYCALKGFDYSDEQLHDTILAGIMSMTEAIHDYLRAFEPEAFEEIEKLDAEAQE